MTKLNKAIAQLTGLVDGVLAEVISQIGLDDLTQQQLNYLRVIDRLGNPTLSELAAELKLTRPTVTVMVDKLVEKGYVRRVKSDADRRSQHLHIDRKGEKIKTIREQAALRISERIGTSLNETESTILGELLKKLHTSA